MKKVILFILPLLFSIPAVAQDSITVQQNTLNAQMIAIFEKSNSYEKYKVIEKVKLVTLKRNILDSISLLESKIKSQQEVLSSQKNEIDTLRQSLTNTKESLLHSRKKENWIEFLGILISKAIYNSIMWSVLIILVIVSSFLFYRFLNSHKITNAAQLKIAEMEIELEDYRRNSLEREQKLRRKLQDEINKNSKS